MFNTTQQLSLKENESECHELAGRAPNYQSRQVLTRLALKIQKTRGLMKFNPLLWLSIISLALQGLRLLLDWIDSLKEESE